MFGYHTAAGQAPIADPNILSKTQKTPNPVPIKVGSRLSAKGDGSGQPACKVGRVDMQKSLT
jgi:hypothetical protein